jgi:hypothetical protein
MLAILRTITIGADATPVNFLHVPRMIRDLTNEFSKTVVTAIENITLS